MKGQSIFQCTCHVFVDRELIIPNIGFNLAIEYLFGVHYCLNIYYDFFKDFTGWTWRHLPDLIIPVVGRWHDGRSAAHAASAFHGPIRVRLRSIPWCKTAQPGPPGVSCSVHKACLPGASLQSAAKPTGVTKTLLRFLAGHSCVWELPTMGPKTWTVFVYIIVFICIMCAMPVVIVGLLWLKRRIRIFRSRGSSDGVGLINI
ncbi:uncharacterized protein [Dermacentor albipictus]|uniref:uncharacterized protein isoform X3 n=1 Tax=Dermacentor albipictus TaxID=60249 RepID=UPI0038FC0E25